MAYKGNFDAMTTLLNYERVMLKKDASDELTGIKQRFKFKNLDIKNGQLVSTVYHDADTIKRHTDFNVYATNLFEKYCRIIITRYRAILEKQDMNGRNPLHYAAMSKYTKCFSTMKILLDIGVDNEPGYDDFLTNYFEIGSLDSSEGRAPIDPRKSSNIIREFEHLLEKTEFNNIMKDFKKQIRKLLKTALNQQDTNNHTPLHIASYFGDFKASRLMRDLGAEAVSENF